MTDSYNVDPIHYGGLVVMGRRNRRPSEGWWIVESQLIWSWFSQEELELEVFIGGTNQHTLKRFSRDVLTGLTRASWAKTSLRREVFALFAQL